MIALRDSLPLVRTEHGNAVAFERTWLRVAIEDAAVRAGYGSWWLVDDLVAGISLYLRNCYVKSVIDLTELEHAVRAALRDIGYEEVAECFHTIPPTQEISLVQCLKNASSISHSTFFEKLSEAINRLREGRVRHFHFYDLHACVDQLESRADRPSSTDPLREKIVAFVRERVHSQGWEHQVWCSIS